MKKLGKVLHLSASHKLIVKSEFCPSIGAEVFDKNGKRVGFILDIFGSVAAPYISIKPTIKNSRTQIGKWVYIGALNLKNELE